MQHQAPTKIGAFFVIKKGRLLRPFNNISLSSISKVLF